MVIDVVTFNGEHDLFEIRYNVLKDYVDEFIVIEFDKSFSGRPKNATFKHFYPKVTYHFVNEDVYSKYMDLALGSPNTIGADHWKREFCQKESIKDYLTHLKDDDIVFIGDCDEVWEPEIIGTRGKIKLRVYSYYLNNLSDEVFYGTITYPYGLIKNDCLNHLRTNSPRYDRYSGWHFTSIGGLEEVRRKLSDSYTEETYWNKDVQSNLQHRFGEKDFLGRPFTFRIDVSDWPQYLKDNRKKYAKLCK